MAARAPHPDPEPPTRHQKEAASPQGSLPLVTCLHFWVEFARGVTWARALAGPRSSRQTQPGPAPLALGDGVGGDMFRIVLQLLFLFVCSPPSRGICSLDTLSSL